MGEVDEAAERVMVAMRALDAHRHAPVPTLEREYRRALEAYFVATQVERAEEEPGDEEIDSDRAGELRRAHLSIEGHYAAARRAIGLARAYRREGAAGEARLHASFEAVQRHRDAIHALRLRARPPAEQLGLPGLAKTRPATREAERVGRTG
jgi:hypothetical protein